VAAVFQAGATIIRRFPVIPAVTVLASGVGMIVALFMNADLVLLIAAAGTLFFAAYVWGYSKRALKHALWPPLAHLPRRSYGEVWDSVAVSRETAAVGVSGQAEESELRASAAPTVRNLLELAAITTNDEVLEIGCGVARIGLELAPHCRKWTGADMSANMIAYAKQRIGLVPNMAAIQLSDVGLAEIPDSSFDVVYSTNVFPHLDEIDRWRYVQEAFRVLRSNGRLFVDNVDLESEAGWLMFVNDAARFAHLERPPYMPRYSTAAELMAYASRAGFLQGSAHHRSPLVIVTAVKP